MAERLRDQLSEYTQETATELAIPGVAVGVLDEGREDVVTHGVTSVDNPLPIDPDTLFGLGSVSKTFTATTLMRLVADGTVDLDAPVRQYVPELMLADEQAAETVTVMNLLNHTSGLDWGLQTDTGEGDDALATYVSRIADLPLLSAPGDRASYSQAGFNLAGRVIELVTGLSFEDAVTRLILQPLELAHSFYAHEDVMTRRFTVAHGPGDNGELTVLRMRRRPRGDNPGGGLASSITDQLRWARFHLGDGRSANGTPILPADVLRQMQQPTTTLRGSNLGDAIGICWFLRDVDGVRTVGHGGSTNGQFADLLLIPDRAFAVVALSNAGPDGVLFNQSVIAWVLREHLGLVDRGPEAVPFDPSRIDELAGIYENDVMTLTVDADAAGLRLEVLLKPEARAAYKEAPPDHEPFHFGLLAGDKDEYIITSGSVIGQRGYFTRNERGAVEGVDLAGRLFRRVAHANNGSPH